MIEVSGSLNIRNSQFAYNTAVTIGVLYSVLANRTLIEGCEFTSNSVTTDVGVLALTY
jgi:hypothetical protein